MAGGTTGAPTRRCGVACSRGCCDTPAEHYRSLTTRVGDLSGKTKVTVEDTGATVNTVTEHWHDRQDVNIRVLEPVIHSAKENT